MQILRGEGAVKLVWEDQQHNQQIYCEHHAQKAEFQQIMHFQKGDACDHGQYPTKNEILEKRKEIDYTL